MVKSEYVFQRVEDQPELERLRMIEQVFVPASRRRLLGSASRGITGDEQELASLRKVNQAIEQMYATLRMDYELGLKLPALMQRRGLQHTSTWRTMPRSVRVGPAWPR
jgi:hypothetical protein